MNLKEYQERLLDAYESYLKACRETGDPAAAFAEATLEEFGHALPYTRLPQSPETPYVCLRVPTGGGKTRLAAQAIARVARSFFHKERLLTLWLVPTEAILTQTLRVLRTPGELLYGDLTELFGPGGFVVMDLDEAKRIQPSTLDTVHVIVVTTMQSFKAEDKDKRVVYRTSGDLMPHFRGVDPLEAGEGAFFDVIRLNRPFVVVDEAHNQGTSLATDTLAAMRPGAVLELTATPDRQNLPSNVLRSVSASTLQNEDMLKLPVELAVHPEWRLAFREALGRLNALAEEAKEEEKLTGEHIRPLMLIQAERKAKDKETFTPDRVKVALQSDFKIPEKDIAINIGDLDEVGDRRMDDPDYPRFIITVDKLREGWDCPFAYVLFSFRGTTSATAVEQVLGRVLRMPHVKRKQREPLNRAYAYAVSAALAETVESLKDGLVQSGFERLEVASLLNAPKGIDEGDLFTRGQLHPIALPTINQVLQQPDLAKLPAKLQDRVELSPESGVLVLRGEITDTVVDAVSGAFADGEAARIVREALDFERARSAGSLPLEQAPALRGEVFRIPLLTLNRNGQRELFDEQVLLDSDWEIDSFDAKLSEDEFPQKVEELRRARIDISKGDRIVIDPYRDLGGQLDLKLKESGWDQTLLVSWLDSQLPFVYASRAQKAAWINAALEHLQKDRGFHLEELAYRKYRLRSALEGKLKQGLTRVKQKQFLELVQQPEWLDSRDSDDAEAVIFQNGRYAYDQVYAGPLRLGRHFFPTIGNLSPSGEEFACAEFIANAWAEVDCWVRNVQCKPNAFWLPTASGRFYPDFIIRLKDGRIVIVEYKGGHLKEGPDSNEKDQVGRLWAARSQGRGLFFLIGKEEWKQLPTWVNQAGIGEMAIIKTPGVCGGEACIRGTRIAVWMLEGYRRLGLDEEALQKNYPQLTGQQIKDALAYAGSHPDEIEQAIRSNEEA